MSKCGYSRERATDVLLRELTLTLKTTSASACSSSSSSSNSNANTTDGNEAPVSTGRKTVLPTTNGDVVDSEVVRLRFSAFVLCNTGSYHHSLIP